MRSSFKKIISFAAAAAIALPLLTSCANTPKEYPLVELSVEKDLVFGEDVSAFLTSEKKETVEACVFSGYEKILSKAQFEGASKDIEVYAAKNESESIVASLFAVSAEAGLEFKIGTLPEDVTAELFIEKTHLIEGENWPDGLLPIRIEPVDLDENELQNILIRFNVGKNAVAGDYEIPVVVTNKNGEVFESLNVSLHIWNFTYSDDYALKTAVGVDGRENYKEYYDFLLDQKISAYDIPYDILSEEAEVYMSDPRVSSFRTGASADIYKKLKSNPEWLSKAYAYPIDEPRNKEGANQLIEVYNSVKSVAPNLNMISPFSADDTYDLPNMIDTVEIFGENMDIYCAKLSLFNDDYIYSNKFQTRGYLKVYGSLRDRLNGFIEKYGRGEIWTYVCWEPGDPYMNFYVNEVGIDHRILFWQQYLVDSTGFLYWSATHWQYVDGDPWTNIFTVPWIDWASFDIYGDGSLLYPGEKYGINGPCGSVRLEAFRDGVEDFELITMVANTLGKDAAMEFVNQVTTSVVDYNKDSANFNSVRIEMGKALEAALNN